ncbi:MAG: site-specific integrase [Alphaproteobacteria bacterium]|jgi:integrase|nr:site-specific integrase [Alphaproteobacteria bacterium]MDP6516242.1 site-specific integrase [Alphaproteobacteria bacterium]
MAIKFMGLTRPAIRQLQPEEKITEHGITAESLADGDVRYSVNVMIDGERVHRVVGRESGGVTRTQAETFIEQARTEARHGRLSLPKGRKAALKFDGAATDYLARLEDSGGKNIVAKKRQIRLYLRPFFASQRLDTISAFTVDRYKRKRQEAGAANGTINLELATLSHLFNKATEWGWLKTPPCRVRLLEKAQGRIIALTDDQADALMRGAVADEDPYCWLFVAFGLNTAMRHSEILRARFDQLDLDNLRLFIPEAKAGQREQPITPELADILRCEREMADDPEGWIFPTPRTGASLTGHRHRMNKPFRRAVVHADLDPATITPHVMRHTAITNLVKSGADLPTIQRISGHKTLAMVLRYTHVHGRHIDQAIKAIGRGIPEPSENENAGTTTPKLHTFPKRAVAGSTKKPLKP